jgi:Ca2+-binding RTX toxin-like protein
MVSGTSVSYFTVYGDAGDDTVDASLVASTPVAFLAGGGADSFTGGGGNDSFSFAVVDLTAADTVVGGAGSGKLVLTTAGTVSAASLANVSGLEALVLNPGGNNVTLTDGMVAGTSVGYFTVHGGAGDDTVDAISSPAPRLRSLPAAALTASLAGAATTPSRLLLPISRRPTDGRLNRHSFCPDGTAACCRRRRHRA